MLSTGIEAPEIRASDFKGNPFDLSSLKSKKVLLSFYRYAGCPFCQLRFLELIDEFGNEEGIRMVAVFQSSSDSIRSYAGGIDSPAIVLADPDEELYRLYGVGYGFRAWILGVKSWVRFVKSILSGNKWGKSEGRSSRLPADFLIDENGDVVYMHYGRSMDDHMPVEIIKNFIRS